MPNTPRTYSDQRSRTRNTPPSSRYPRSFSYSNNTPVTIAGLTPQEHLEETFELEEHAFKQQQLEEKEKEAEARQELFQPEEEATPTEEGATALEEYTLSEKLHSPDPIIIPEEKLEQLTYLPQKFKEILQDYTESRDNKFKQVLMENYGYDKDIIDNIGSTEPLESFVLFHQMNLHRDVISKIEEARYIPQNITEQLKPSIGGEELLGNLSLKLQDLMKNNFESRNQKLKNVLLNSGFDKDEISQLDPNEPMEGFILKHQVNLHQEMKSMLKENKELMELMNQHFLKLTEPEKCLKEKPTDCCDIYLSGKNRSGVYQIYPISDPEEVYCDMETHGGGWTVFLSRGDHSPKLNFTRSWMDYKAGFGRADAEYWLGNELLSWLTQNRNYSIRMDAKDDVGREIWGEWGKFKVDSELSKYQLTISDFDPRSTAFDRLTYFNGMKFTSFDNDNDGNAGGNCASLWKGGWWYKNCHWVNPTGIHADKTGTGIQVRPWSKAHSGVGFADWLQMKIRQKICS